MRGSKAGFTLIETLVAITMLTTVIATIMSLVQTSLQANAYAQDQVVAKNLAEEGIEYIRNIRDVNMINGANWLTSIAKDVSSPCGNIAGAGAQATCKVDPFTLAIPSTCTTSDNSCTLKYDSTNGRYTYASGTLSKFKRSITVQRVDQDSGSGLWFSVLVQSTVTWSEPTGTRTYVASEYLFNWYTGS